MKKNLAILHYLPLEYYPPVTNLIDYIANEHSEDFNKVKVFTSKNIKERKEYQVKENGEWKKKTGRNATSEDIKGALNRGSRLKSFKYNIYRSPFPKETNSGLKRLLKYLHYDLFTLIRLIGYQPESLLYYESYSVWPAYIYTKFINRKCRVFIHNHEYASKEWYASTMKQVRYFHKFEEKWLYRKALWISQTNEERKKLFQKDYPYLSKDTLKIVPNYPPSSWHNVSLHKKQKSNNRILRVVYIGSLSLKNTYIKELCEWVIRQKGNIKFDIYSYIISQDANDYLSGIKNTNIEFFKSGIEYDNIPNILSKYDVGVIFYTAYSDNVINCVSNKFYEYFTCGLDIWFSKTMKSTYQHIDPKTYPAVIPIDFTKLKHFNWQKAVDKTDRNPTGEKFFCEDVYQKLVDEMVGE